jgi:phospholipid-binding lipoprotein MlaA
LIKIGVLLGLLMFLGAGPAFWGCGPAGAAPPEEAAAEDIPAEFLDDDLDFLDEEEEQDVPRVADPLAPWNRLMYHFNDKLYFWVLKPVARGYKAVTPTPARTGVKNFFHNLIYPIRLVNCLAQGKMNAAGTETERFLTNTFVGILGFGDPARHQLNMLPHDEDLGQTLAHYGVGDGFYIVWPILGPSTLRDSVGFVGDRFLNPVTYVDPLALSLGIKGYETINDTSFRIGDYEALKEAAVEPYNALRNAYIQYRRTQVAE